MGKLDKLRKRAMIAQTVQEPDGQLPIVDANGSLVRPEPAPPELPVEQEAPAALAEPVPGDSGAMGVVVELIRLVASGTIDQNYGALLAKELLPHLPIEHIFPHIQPDIQDPPSPPVVNVSPQVNVPVAPAPVVNVPQGQAPQVNVNVPQQAPPNVSVNVPEQPPATVNVAAPNVSVAAPNVNVAAPSVSVEAPSVTVNPELRVPSMSGVARVSERDANGRIREMTMEKSDE